MNSQNRIEITRAGDFPHFPEAAAVVISSVRLPCLTFSRVKVRQEIERRLGVVERFALQVGLRLGRFQPRHLQELTSIPEAAVVRFLDGLVRAETLATSAEGFYEIRSKQAKSALEEEVTREEVIGTQNFLWLPRTDDLFAFDEDDKGFELLTKLQPAGQAPVPEPHRNLPCGEWLEQRITASEVCNLPKNILGVAMGATLATTMLPELCPEYPCEGFVFAAVEHDRLRLSIEGQQTQKRPGPQWVHLDLLGKSRLATQWRELAGMPLQASRLEMVAEAAGLRRRECQSIRAVGPLDLALAISSEASERLAGKGVVLSVPFGLTIRSAEEACVEVRARYEPVDRAGALPFAIDAAVVDILQNTQARNPAAAVESALQKAVLEYLLADDQINAEPIMERLWSLGHYDYIYRARAEQDFSYDTAN